MAAMASDSNGGAEADRIAELQESVKRIEVSLGVVSVVLVARARVCV